MQVSWDVGLDFVLRDCPVPSRVSDVLALNMTVGCSSSQMSRCPGREPLPYNMQL